MGLLGFTWVDLVGSGRLGINCVILEAQESHRQTHTEFLRCTEILSDLINTIIDRPGVAGAVLQTALLLTD